MSHPAPPNGSGSRSCSLDPQLSRTPRSRGPPLSFWSAHPLHTKLSWPFGYMTSMMKLCSERCLAIEALQRFVSSFVVAHEPEALIEALKQHAGVVVCRAFDDTGSRRLVPASTAERTRWLVIPFHPVWELGSLQARLSRRVAEPDVQVAWRGAWRSPLERTLRIRIAWASAGSSLAAQAERYVGMSSNLMM